MVKRVIKIIVIIISVIAVIFGVFFLYANKTKTTEKYMYSFAKNLFDSTYMNWNEPGNNSCCVIELVDYDMLSDKYKRIVSKDEFTNANTDEQIFDIYRRISAANSDQLSERNIIVSSTAGYDMASGTDGFIIDGKAYHITHDFDFKPRLFSDTPHISKWMIDIREVSIDENED